MKKFMKGGAKRLMFSLLALSALGGCAVYGPAPGPYAYPTDAYGQPVYAPAPVYAAPYYNPVYVGPPVFFNFGFRSGGGHHGGHHGGGRGFGGGHGGHGGGHR